MMDKIELFTSLRNNISDIPMREFLNAEIQRIREHHKKMSARQLERESRTNDTKEKILKIMDKGIFYSISEISENTELPTQKIVILMRMMIQENQVLRLENESGQIVYAKI